MKFIELGCPSTDSWQRRRIVFLDFFRLGIFVSVERGSGDLVYLEAFMVGCFLILGSIAFIIVLLAECFRVFLLVSGDVLFFLGFQTLSSILLQLLDLLADLLCRFKFILELLEHLQVVLNLLAVLALPILQLRFLNLCRVLLPIHSFQCGGLCERRLGCGRGRDGGVESLSESRMGVLRVGVVFVIGIDFILGKFFLEFGIGSSIEGLPQVGIVLGNFFGDILVIRTRFPFLPRRRSRLFGVGGSHAGWVLGDVFCRTFVVCGGCVDRRLRKEGVIIFIHGPGDNQMLIKLQIIIASTIEIIPLSKIDIN